MEEKAGKEREGRERGREKERGGSLVLESLSCMERPVKGERSKEGGRRRWGRWRRRRGRKNRSRP